MLKFGIKQVDKYRLLHVKSLVSFLFTSLIPYRERASERYGIKNRVNKNDIRLLTCNNLFITHYMLKKIKPLS